jgi:hypothetical protein
MQEKPFPNESEPELTGVWDSKAKGRCIVCNRPSKGKAICGETECANMLARG